MSSSRPQPAQVGIPFEHEPRAPDTAQRHHRVLGGAPAAPVRELNAKQADYLQDILDSGRHQLTLVNDILDLSKVEAGTHGAGAFVVLLNETINSCVACCVKGPHGEASRSKSRATRHRRDRADQRKVKQVLFNLLSNAVKFTPEGGRITVRCARSGSVVEVSVQTPVSASHQRIRNASSRNRSGELRKEHGGEHRPGLTLAKSSSSFMVAP